MASVTGVVWAIDIGNNSLKALQLAAIGDNVEVIGFDNIPHGKILSGSGVSQSEKEELVAISLHQFLTQNSLGKADIIVSVPSQNSFARFVNLPPVEKKRIPEIVKFEAAQQIPFDINEVQWDWQLVSQEGEENKVGIFAIKNEAVASELEYFNRVNMQVQCVQMSPMALYNYILYDRPDLVGSDSQAIAVLNMGAEITDLVVCTKSSVWQRCILMGGNSFTKAIAEAFKLNFEKAEKLKRTAPMSKYARQILQAMKPVFTDLASEIQRSLGFYNNSNPNIKLTKIIALGGSTKMRGLLKYLQQTLQIPIETPDSFKRLSLNPAISAAKFHDSVCDFGIVYGLGLQGLGLGKIESNLLPRSIARSMIWASKTKYFIAAACLLLLVSILAFARTFLDKAGYNERESVREKISTVIIAGDQAIENLKSEENKAGTSAIMIQKSLDFFKYRNAIPLLHETIISILPNERNTFAPEQKELYKAFAEGDIEKVMEMPRDRRKQVFLTGIAVKFVDDVSTAGFISIGKTRKDVRREGREVVTAGEEVLGVTDVGGMGGPMAPKGERSKPKLKKSPEKKSPEKIKKPDYQKAEPENKAGFVVSIVGYSPHEKLEQLMDPIDTGSDKSKWGIITRMMNLDETLGTAIPFELYKKTEIRHFSLEIGEVELGSEIPAGIGIVDSRVIKVSPEKARRTTMGTTISLEEIEDTLVDRMTKETISKVAELDENGMAKTDRSGNTIYKVNDHWFVLNAKFTWKDAQNLKQ